MDQVQSQLIISSIEGSQDSQKSPESLPLDKPTDMETPAEAQQPKSFHFQETLEAQLKLARQDREDAVEDRDRLFNILERRSMEIERLETDLKVLRKQLQSSIDVKCDAVRKYEEVQHKVAEIEFKEKRMEQERLLLQNQVDMMSTDLTRNIQELQQTRKESSMRIMMLEAKLHEKTEELNISILHESQLRESNEALSTKVDELSKEILRVNEEFSASMKKYQQELASKSRLVDLYKEKCEDAVTEQKDITAVVAELRTALKEATEEYGKIEAELKERNLQHEKSSLEQAQTIENLQTELSNANVLLEAAKRENLEIAVEKLCPSAVASPKLSSKTGHSISQVYSMYINASEDLDLLSIEHEKLKETFTQVVHEIEDKAPEIQKTQLELMKLREAYQTLGTEYRTLKTERLDAQDKIDMLMLEMNKSAKKFKELQLENKDLSNQVCQLLHVIEGKPVGRTSGDVVAENCVTFNDVKQLQENNLKLISLVRQLTTVVEELDSSGIKSQENATETECQTVEDTSHVELTKQLKQSADVLTKIKQKHEEQLSKKDKSMDQLKSQIEDVKNQIADLSSTNFKLRAELEHKSDQLKLQQKNMEATKRKLQSIEDKSRTANTSIARMETSMTHIRNELQSTTMRLNRAEMSVDALTKENRNLIRAEAHLRAENDVFKRQQSHQASLMNNIETIKSILERSETESSARRMAEKIEELTRNCEELEKALAVEKKNFTDFEAQANAAIEELETENQRLNDELTIANDEVESKSVKIAELARKILEKDDESESESESDTEVASLKESVKELRKIGRGYKKQFLEIKEQIESVKNENGKLKEAAAGHLAEIGKMNENFEKEKNAMRGLLTKARGMIKKLSEENEELKQQQAKDLDTGKGCKDEVSVIPKEPMDTKESKGNKEPMHIKEPMDTKESIDIKESKDIKEPMDTKEPLESKPVAQKRQRDEEEETGTDSNEKKAKVDENQELKENVVDKKGSEDSTKEPKEKSTKEPMEVSQESTKEPMELPKESTKELPEISTTDSKIPEESTKEAPMETASAQLDTAELKNENDQVETVNTGKVSKEQEKDKHDDAVVILDDSAEETPEGTTEKVD